MSIQNTSNSASLKSLIDSTQKFVDGNISNLQTKTVDYNSKQKKSALLSSEGFEAVRKFFQDNRPPTENNELDLLREKIFYRLNEKDQKKIKKSVVKYFDKLSSNEEYNRLFTNSSIHANLRKNFSKTSEKTFVAELEYRAIFLMHYKDVSNKLTEISLQLETLAKADDTNFNKDELELLRASLHSLYDSYAKMLGCYEKNDRVDLNYALLFGEINAGFKKINDLVDRCAEKFAPNPHNHALCAGCQFSATSPTHNELPINPGKGGLSTKKNMLDKNFLNVAGPRKALEKKIQSQEEKITRCEDLPEKEKLVAEKTFLENELKNIISYENHDSILTTNYPTLAKKSILLLTCSYGTGHKTTTEGVAKALGKTGAHVSVADFSIDVLLGEDKLYRSAKFFDINSPNDSHSPFRSVDAFNLVLKNQWYKFINLFNKVDRWLRNLLGLVGKHGVASANPADRNSRAKQLVRERLLLERPDHIVTTYHMDLNLILEVAKDLGIPVLHIPTDYNMKCNEPFDETYPNYEHFKMLVPSNHPKFADSSFPLKPHQLVKGAGIPLRPEFYKHSSAKEIAEIKKEKNIPQNAKVVLTLTGGNGQSVPFPEKLANSKTYKEKTHLIIIAGANRQFVEYLQDFGRSGLTMDPKTRFLSGSNSNVTIEIAEDPTVATKEKPYYIGAGALSKLMDISDGAISKAGGISVAELIYKQVPILFDRRKIPFGWEDENIEAVTTSLRGVACNSLKSFERDLTASLALGKAKSENFCYGDTLDIVCEQIASQLRISEQDPSQIYKKNQYADMNFSKSSQLGKDSNESCFDAIEFFITSKELFSIGEDKGGKLFIYKKNNSECSHMKNFQLLFASLQKEYDAIKTAHPKDNPLSVDSALAKKYYAVNLYLKQAITSCEEGDPGNIMDSLTAWKKKLLCIKLGGEISEQDLTNFLDFERFIENNAWHNKAIAYNHVISMKNNEPHLLVNGISRPWSEVKNIQQTDGTPWINQYNYLENVAITAKGLVSTALDKFIPHSHDDPGKWGNQYVLEIVSGKDKQSKDKCLGTHSWIRLKTPDGDIYSHGLYGGEVKGLEKLSPYAIRKGAADSPDRFDTLEPGRIEMQVTSIPIKAAQFDLLKSTIEGYMEDGIPYGFSNYNCTSHVRALAALVNVDVGTEERISSFVAKKVFHVRIQRFFKRFLGARVKKMTSWIALKICSLALLIMGGNRISKDFKDGEQIKKIKTRLGYTDSPEKLYQWHNKIKTKRFEESEDLKRDIAYLENEYNKALADVAMQQHIERIIIEKKKKLSMV